MMNKMKADNSQADASRANDTAAHRQQEHKTPTSTTGPGETSVNAGELDEEYGSDGREIETSALEETQTEPQGDKDHGRQKELEHE